MIEIESLHIASASNFTGQTLHVVKTHTYTHMGIYNYLYFCKLWKQKYVTNIEYVITDHYITYSGF